MNSKISLLKRILIIFSEFNSFSHTQLSPCTFHNLKMILKLEFHFSYINKQFQCSRHFHGDFKSINSLIFLVLFTKKENPKVFLFCVLHDEKTRIKCLMQIFRKINFKKISFSKTNSPSLL